MPVLSEDSGECPHPAWACHSPGDRSLPGSPELERDQALLVWPLEAALPANPGEVLRAGMKCYLRVPRGRKSPPPSFVIPSFSYSLLRFA